MNDLSSIISNAKTIESEYIRFDKLSALVIDDMGAMRQAIKSQLQSMGITMIRATSSAQEALRLIESIHYDLIMCDYNLNNASSGQHFLEYLRTEGLLTPKTIFVMVTAEAEYAYVANAAEFGPDDYILKPCPEQKLKMRLIRLFDRRTFLLPVIEAIEAGKFELALGESDRLISREPNERWLMSLFRLKAEAQFALGLYQNILETYEQALAIRNTEPWVKIGIARIRKLLGDPTAARQISREIIAEHPNYVAAYELLAQTELEQGNEEGAYQLLLDSSRILPSAKRIRSVSESAYLLGKLDDAKKYAEAAIRLSNGSIVEKPDDFISLAQIQVDMGEPESAIDTLERVARHHEARGDYGIAKFAILGQAYADADQPEKARKYLKKSEQLVTEKTGCTTLAAVGKAAIKNGNLMLGLKLLTRSVQSSGEDKSRVMRRVTKVLIDTGQSDKVEDVLDAGQRHILALVDEASKLMRAVQFSTAYDKVLEALAIHDENIEALLAAAQLHLLWLKQDGMDEAIAERAKGYLAKLDKLLPRNEKVLGFYRFFNELTRS